MDTWDDKTTGEKRSKIKVQADRVQFLDSRRATGPAAPAAWAPMTRWRRPARDPGMRRGNAAPMRGPSGGYGEPRGPANGPARPAYPPAGPSGPSHHRRRARGRRYPVLIAIEPTADDRAAMWNRLSTVPSSQRGRRTSLGDPEERTLQWRRTRGHCPAHKCTPWLNAARRVTLKSIESSQPSRPTRAASRCDA